MTIKKIILMLLVAVTLVFCLGFVVGYNIRSNILCEDSIKLVCAVYNRSMSCFANENFTCNPIDFSGSRIWIFKPPCSENLTEMIICDYNLTSKVFMNCTRLNLTNDSLI